MASARKAAILAWLLLVALAGSAWAGEVQIPTPTSPVMDLAGVLDPASRTQLLQVIQGVRDRTTAEIAVLTVPSTAPLDVEQYSVEVFGRWKIGQHGKDNGLLFVVATQDRRLWITTGYGLEGILPDGKIGAIRDRDIIPYFRQGRYAEGILQGTRALASVILADASGGASPAGSRPVRRSSGLGSGSTGPLLLIFILLILFSAGVSAMDRPAGLTPHARRLRRSSWWWPWWFGGFGGGFGSGFGGWSSGGFGGWSGGGFSSGGFGGFGGGDTGGGGAGGGW